jgi:hypothetical protein
MHPSAWKMTSANFACTEFSDVAFLVVCGLKVVTGWLLWRGLRAGAVLAVALLPFELAFWIGFALPSFVSGSRWRRVTPKERSAPNHTCQLRARTTDVKR